MAFWSEAEAIKVKRNLKTSPRRVETLFLNVAQSNAWGRQRGL
jgi:hypothetical protein